MVVGDVDSDGGETTFDRVRFLLRRNLVQSARLASRLLRERQIEIPIGKVMLSYVGRVIVI